MSTTCDHILIPTSYSADASGGPEWATSIIRSGEGGAIAHRNINSEDFVSKYEIEFNDLSKERKANLRNFAILRHGQARAFLFLAPDDSELIDERVGYLNPATGEVGYLSQTNGSLTDFYTIKNYSDPFIAYNRRLCKLSSYETFTVEFFAANDLNNSLGFVEFEPDDYTENYFDAVAESKSQNINIGGTNRTVTIYYREGRINVAPALPAGLIVKVSGAYLLPVVFNDDWMKFSIDEAATGSFKIGVTEVLPVELGLI